MSRVQASADGPVTIGSFSEEGRGVARVVDRDGKPGKTVFIAGALPGETVKYKRLKKRRSYDEAIAIEIVDASSDRVNPACEYFGVCGGCSLQHLQADRQIEFKQGVLAEQLQRIGGVTPVTWLPALTGQPWGYRRRARLGVKRVDKKGRVLVGFRERSKPYIADMHRCMTLAAPVGDMLDALSELIGALSISRRLPQIEVAVADNAVALVFRVLDQPDDNDLAAFHAFANAHNVYVFLQPKGLESVYPLNADQPALVYRIDAFDITITFEPTDFIQVNSTINERMVQQTIDLLAIEPAHTVLDLFCGLGNFSLPLARHAAHVIGVEGDLALVKRAGYNAMQNGIDNIEFFLGNLFEPDEETPWMRRSFDAILLDPPRAGAQEIAEAIDRFDTTRIVYVSCNPATLARDAAILTAQEYTLQSAGVMDMFPHTSHIESIALFQR